MSSIGVFLLSFPFYFWTAGFALAFLLIAYAGLPSILYLITVALLFGYLKTSLCAWISLAGFGVLFFIPQIRKYVITKPLISMLGLKKALSKISETEQIALEAGDTWFEKELFSGKPNFEEMSSLKTHPLTEEENLFLQNQTEALCNMVTEWEISEKKDMPAHVWDYLKKERFFGMLIPKKYGGLEFSAIAQSSVVAKLATRSEVVAITAMVPNSLGPGELLLKYGTDSQKNYYLPRLADGREVPCFGLTEPNAGSDASSIRSSGVVFKMNDGSLGIRLSFEKRYITLGGVATIIGLAFKLEDPEKLLPSNVKTGITCIILKGDTAGITRGRRHNPLGVQFVNSPIWGKDVEVNIEDCVIGGIKGCGEGWRMLMECLSVGRGISLPAISTGGANLLTRYVTNYASIRNQFGLSIAKLEGVQQVIAEIIGLNYSCNAIREITATAVSIGKKPSVVNAIAKYHTTEMFRKIVNHSMDVLGGGGICMGPNNPVAHAYMSAPIAITVEGANIMTRTLLQFGQGLVRCHPYSYEEIISLSSNNIKRFDIALWRHVGYFFSNFVRSLVFLSTFGLLHRASFTRGCILKSAERKLAGASANFAFYSDVALFYYGGALKRKGILSGYFGDAISQMYIIYCIMQKFKNDGMKKDEKTIVSWALNHHFKMLDEAFFGIRQNLFENVFGYILRIIPMFKFASSKALNAKKARHIVESFTSSNDVKTRMTNLVFTPTDPSDKISLLEKCAAMVKPYEDVIKKIKKSGKSIREYTPAKLHSMGVITDFDLEICQKYEEIYTKVVSVDNFELKTTFGL